MIGEERGKTTAMPLLMFAEHRGSHLSHEMSAVSMGTGGSGGSEAEEVSGESSGRVGRIDHREERILVWNQQFTSHPDQSVARL